MRGTCTPKTNLATVWVLENRCNKLTNVTSSSEPHTAERVILLLNVVCVLFKHKNVATFIQSVTKSEWEHSSVCIQFHTSKRYVFLLDQLDNTYVHMLVSNSVLADDSGIGKGYTKSGYYCKSQCGATAKLQLYMVPFMTQDMKWLK